MFYDVIAYLLDIEELIELLHFLIGYKIPVFVPFWQVYIEKMLLTAVNAVNAEK